MSVVVLTIAVSARGQYRVGNDGRALDANPRLGSGGYNDASPGFLNPSFGNQIITGNVTGDKQFRGYVPYTDPKEFRGGNSTNSMDSFIARSGGYSLTRNDNPNAATPFYAGKLANPMASGFSTTGISGTYIPSNSVSTEIDPSADTRIAPIRTNETIALSSGSLVLQGPYDPKTNQITLYTASSLMGVRSWSSEEFNALNSSLMSSRYKFNDSAINKMRQEISDLSVSSFGLSRPAPTAIDAPGSGLIKNDPLIDQVKNNQISPLVGGGLPSMLPSASQQSSQNAELERRLNAYYSEVLQTNEAKYAEQLKELKSRVPTNKEDKPSTDIPDYQGIGRSLPKNFLELPDTVAPKALAIDSLASGVTASGLAQLLKQGEDLTRDGKYEQAMEIFAAASEVAPNNYLATIGTAHAALAGGFFKKAETAVRAAYLADPSLLMAKFNLKKMIGQDALPNVVNQLKQAANSQQDDPGLAMLLCYVSYHNDYISQAGIYLDLAEKRSAGKDPFYPYLRAHWKVPTTAESLMPVPAELVIKQIEGKNVASIKLVDSTLLGVFRKAVTVDRKTVTNFTAELPKGAAGASTIKWIKDNGMGIKLELGE